MMERWGRETTFPPQLSTERSRMTYCSVATGVFVRLHISCDGRRTSWFIRNKAWGRQDECINQIPCCAGSDRKHGAHWMHDWLLALSWCLSVFLCIFMERLSAFGCSNITFLHARCSALHTLISTVMMSLSYIYHHPRHHLCHESQKNHTFQSTWEEKQ